MTDTLADAAVESAVAPSPSLPSAPAPVLSVRGLAVDFPHRGRTIHAVRGVSFDISAGECVAVVGESGSGKSVTARSLLGVAGPDARVTADRLRWGATDLRGLSERRWRGIRGRHIALVLQDALTSLDPLHHVGTEVSEPLAVHRILPRRERRSRVRELLASVGVPNPDVRARQYPHELSGGLRQRALIASALAGEPELVIADEPTTALDVTVQAQVLALLAHLKQCGTALLLISHDLAVVSAIADRVLVMHDGVVVEDGPTLGVLTEPRHRYTRRLLDAVPGPDSRGRRLTADVPHQVQLERPAPTEHAAAPVLIEVDGLRKTYRAPGAEPTVALEDVSFILGRSEILGVVGESGSGKSTAARVVLGLTEPDSGTVKLLGEQWSGVAEARRRSRRPTIQHISQDPLSSFDPRQRAGSIISEALEQVGVPRTERAAEVTRLLASVGLHADVAGRRPSSLSGGQRQRVAIARALATRPSIIVCDEAVSALDVSIQAQVLDLLAELRERTGVAILFISHDLGVIHHIADRVLVMKDGRIVEQGPVEDIFTAPKHPYTQRLLASLPVLPSRTQSTERNPDAQD